MIDFVTDKDLVLAVANQRKAQGLSLRQLGHHIGVSFSSLARIERGEGFPSLDTRITLLEWTGQDASHERSQRDKRFAMTPFEMQAAIEALQARVWDLEASMQILLPGR